MVEAPVAVFIDDLVEKYINLKRDYRVLQQNYRELTDFMVGEIPRVVKPEEQSRMLKILTD